MLDTIETIDKRRQMENFVDNCQFETPDEVARLFREYTFLIWDYKLIGKIYDYYPDQLILHTEHTTASTNVETVVANTMAFTAAVPDNETLFLDIFAEGNQEDGYRFFQATRTIGTNTGYGSAGAPTGRSFEEEGPAGIGTCECLVQKVGGHWKIIEEWLVRSTLAEREVMAKDEKSLQKVDRERGGSRVCCEMVDTGERGREQVTNSNEKSQEIKRRCAEIDCIEMKDAGEVRAFVENMTKLIYDYRMTGKIYDFYARDVEYHKQNKISFDNVEKVVRQTAAFCAAFPDLETEIESIIVEQPEEGFYKVARRMRWRGTNLGFSQYGPPTGKSLGDCCRNLTMMYLKKMGDQWKITLEISNDCEEWLREVMNAPHL